MGNIEVTERTRLRRLPKRGCFDRDAIWAILDEALLVHVGFYVAGQSYVIPTTYVRIDDAIYIHGSAASRLIQVAESGVALCATATLLDGLVLARSAFHHSMNYRSVVILGQARRLDEPEHKLRVLAALIERLAPGRAEEVRAPSALELKATHVLAIPLTEASAKVRTGPPLDDADDLALACWAGVIPLQLRAGAAVPDLPLPGSAKVPSLHAALRLHRCACTVKRPADPTRGEILSIMWLSRAAAGARRALSWVRRAAAPGARPGRCG
jgi:uncharacterized protein